MKVQLAHDTVNRIVFNEVNELTRLKGSRAINISSFVLFSLLVLEAPIPVCSIEIIAIVENFC